MVNDFCIGEGAFRQTILKRRLAAADAVGSLTADGNLKLCLCTRHVGDTQFCADVNDGSADDAVANFFAITGLPATLIVDDAGDATSLSNEIIRVTGLRDDFDVLEADVSAWKCCFASGYN